MTEAEWLTSEDLPSMLRLLVKEKGWLVGPIGDRRFLLYACACCRLGEKNEYLKAVDLAEQFADGLAGEHVQAAQRYNEPAIFHAPFWGLFVVPNGGSLEFWNLAEPVMTREEWPLYTQLVREVFGNPFRPITVDPRWLSETVVALARGIYDDRAFERMLILADALAEAGCESEDVLRHCREPGEHVRGCWVVDLLLGKQ